ncbi:MAG: type II toxin-antitoxin system RelB/DinJ family antitoxin [Desulfatibacillum sp.]|nr:type II toxin-antitoxin system RelB/DinJ family antitoxin [Desulfatibacillum sp.]
MGKTRHTAPKQDAFVQARIDKEVKITAEAVLAAIGLTPSSAIRMLMNRIAYEKALPFEPLIPNQKTIEAMEAARRGDVVKVGGIDNLLGSLNAGD